MLSRVDNMNCALINSRDDNKFAYQQKRIGVNAHALMNFCCMECGSQFTELLNDLSQHELLRGKAALKYSIKPNTCKHILNAIAFYSGERLSCISSLFSRANDSTHSHTQRQHLFEI